MNEYENYQAPEQPGAEQQPVPPVNPNPPVYEAPVVENPAPAAPAAPAKKGFQLNKKLLIPAVAVAAVALVVVIVASILLSSPLALIGRGFNNTLKAMEKNELVELVTDVYKGGSVELQCSLNELPMDLPVEADASVKLYTSLPEKTAMTASLIVDDEPLLDGAVIVDQKSVAVGSEALLGGEYYGVNMESVMENFEDSIFGYDGEYSLGFELPEGYEDVMAEAEEVAKESKDIARLVAATALKSLKKHAEISKERETLELADKKVKTTAVEVKLTPKALANMAADMVEFLRDNKKVKRYLEDNAEFANSIMELADMDYYGDAEDLIDEMYDALDELELDKSDIKSLERSLKATGFDMTVVFYITNSGKEIIGLDFDGEIEGETVKLSVQAGPSWKNLNEINFRMEDGYSIYRGAYVVETNDRKEFEADLKIREDNEVLYSAKISHDKKDDDFEIEITDHYWEETYGAEGTFQKTSKGLTAVLETVYGEGEELDLGITAIVSRSDKAPAMPKYNDVLDLDEYDVEALVEDLEESVFALGMIFADF